MTFIAIEFNNQSSYTLTLAGSLVSPDGWIGAPPKSIAAGTSQSISSNQPNYSFTLVAGYTVENGYILNVAWAMVTYSDPPQVVTTDTAFDVKVGVSVEGNSEDGYKVTLTYS